MKMYPVGTVKIVATTTSTSITSTSSTQSTTTTHAIDTPTADKQEGIASGRKNNLLYTLIIMLLGLAVVGLAFGLLITGRKKGVK